MLLSNQKRLKIQGIIKRIAQDKSITLEERIYVEKFENTPIKIQKKFFKTFTLKKIEKEKIFQDRNELHQQMQLVFA